MERKFLITGGILAGLAVLLGAFGAHALKKLVDAAGVASFNTGVRYQMYHAIVFLVIANIKFLPVKAKKQLFYIFLTGVVLFSGSIYFLVLDEILGISLSSIAFVTPFGGLLLIFGWIFFVYQLFKNK